MFVPHVQDNYHCMGQSVFCILSHACMQAPPALGQYIVYGLLYLVFYHLLGFELTVICGIGNVLGELHYQEKK